MSSLKVVCLISGGKDSLFSILHCLRNGHEVVALANLHPPETEEHGAVEDLDSYMYQTVGHRVIPLYEKALGLPLYRQAVSGSAVNQEKCYGPTSDQDETEVLLPLLRNVKAHHPQVNAVSTGAILSDYQRTRVESVAIRLGLVPLSYLWQWPNLRPHTQDSLLRDMATVGQDSRIIKVASGGLDETMLWRNVADPQTISCLTRAAQRFGDADDGAVLGEGGEYETLAVAGPTPLWKGCLVVDASKREVVLGEAGSASVHVIEARVEMNEAHSTHLDHPPVPPVLEPQFEEVLGLVRNESVKTSISCHPPTSRDTSTAAPALPSCHHTLLTNLVGNGLSAVEQMQSIMEQASTVLKSSGNSLTDVAYSSIVLKDMDDFPEINSVYGFYFSHPNPPARATIACASVLPEGKYVLVSLTFLSEHNSRSMTGLHVQSRSYWAPANIGPYSQAMSCLIDANAAVVYVAGQIPLIPASMELPLADVDLECQSFALQAVLAQQHFDRIGRVMQVQSWACGIAFIVASSVEEASQRSACVHRVWETYFRSVSEKPEQGENPDEVEESFDVWDAKFGLQRDHVGPNNSTRASSFRTVDLALVDRALAPPLRVIRVDALPRGANVEWVTFGLAFEGDFPHRSGIPHYDHLIDLLRDQSIR
jgi:diphthine-ammonia ligase